MQEDKSGGGGISVLPEDCISRILSFTCPQDVYTSSLVSSVFKSAADSDNVWENFLPPDYKDIIEAKANDSSSSVFNNLNDCSSKKELYFRFCSPVLLEGGNQSISLEKKSGKVCLMLGSKMLTIKWSDRIEWRNSTGGGFLWGEDVDYWKWASPSHSRSAEAIELVIGYWFFISGKIETRKLSPNTTYAAYLVFKHKDYACGLGVEYEHKAIEYAWAGVSVSFIRGEGIASGYCEKSVRLQSKQRPSEGYASVRCEYQYPCDSKTGWAEL